MNSRSCEVMHERAVEVAQEALEPDDRLEVEVVGRLVEQQRVGLHEQDARECDAHLPTARQLAHVVVDRLRPKAQAGQDLTGARLERVAAQLVEARLRHAEALDQLVEFVDARRVGHRMLERVQLVAGFRHRAGARHRLFDHTAALHLARRLG